MKNLTSITREVLVVCFGMWAVQSTAATVPLTFTKLAGTTGGVPASTGVYRADLSGLGITSLLSISISDNSSGLGGSPGQFSGFDLDAIKLSTTSVGTAANAQSLAELSVFDFSPTGTFFNLGSQRPPADPKLFGTGLSGSTVDNSVATLGAFDGNATTAIPGAFGFISMGDNGTLSFNLTSAVDLTTPLYLYIGEVGDNGEVAASSIKISDTPAVPIPAAVWLFGSGLSMFRFVGSRRNRRVAQSALELR